MSLAQAAVEQHTEILAREHEGHGNDHERLSARYVELMLSGDDSAEARRELSDTLFFLRDSETRRLTPETVLADERAIQQARRLMALAADRAHAVEERQEQAELYVAVKYLASEWPRYQARVSAAAMDYYDQCAQAAVELEQMAERHPEFFTTDRSGRPLLISADAEAIAAEARQVRRVESLRERIRECDAAIEPMAEALDQMSADDDKRASYAFWMANREDDRRRLVAELERLALSADDDSTVD